MPEICVECGKEITFYQTKISTQGKHYHSDCFKCNDCGTKLSGKPFFTVNDKRSCKDCYEKEHAPKCRICKKPIIGQSTTAGKFHYHPDCFRCAACNIVIEKSYRLNRHGKPQCPGKCPEGGDQKKSSKAEPERKGSAGEMTVVNDPPPQEVAGEYEQADNLQADDNKGKSPEKKINSDPDSPKCGDCKKDLTNVKYYVLDDERKVCSDCFKTNHSATCYICKKPILHGQSHVVKDWKFHKDCFNCAKCGKYMGKLRLKLEGENIVCYEC